MTPLPRRFGTPLEKFLTTPLIPQKLLPCVPKLLFGSQKYSNYWKVMLKVIKKFRGLSVTKNHQNSIKNKKVAFTACLHHSLLPSIFWPPKYSCYITQPPSQPSSNNSDIIFFVEMPPGKEALCVRYKMDFICKA